MNRKIYVLHVKYYSMAGFFFSFLGIVYLDCAILCTALLDDCDFEVGESSKWGVGVWRRWKGFL